MVSHQDVVDAFLLHRKKKGNSVFSKGEIIYSYGYHFPMGIWSTNGKRVYVNRDRYSVSTSKHQSILKWSIWKKHIPYYEVNTEKMRELEVNVGTESVPDKMPEVDVGYAWDDILKDSQHFREKDWISMSKEERTRIIEGGHPNYVSADILKKYPIIHRRPGKPKPGRDEIIILEPVKPVKIKEETVEDAIGSWFKKRRQRV